MPINILMKINFDKTTKIEQIIPGHPVYRVTLRPQPPAPDSVYIDIDETDTVIIKSESARKRTHVTDPLKIMNLIDTSASARQLNQDEVLALEQKIPKRPEMEGLLGDIKAAYTHRINPLDPKPIFFVMEDKSRLTNLGTIDQANEEQVKGIRNFLNQPNSLEKLGEILAADAFIGNEDRIIFNENARPDKPNLRCIQNPGNLFISGGYKTAFVGLDTFDMSNQFKDLETFPLDEKKSYPGKILHAKEGERRLTLAKKVVADIETLLGERKSKILGRPKNHLKLGADMRIVKGMEEGAQKIKGYLLSEKYKNNDEPESVHSRLLELGWRNPTLKRSEREHNLAIPSVNRRPQQ